ncbi:MAG TPA: response regulator transcription factor [Pirellulales bacterium]|jgi:DNA-binding NarL/FixJ family response regulator|nr:response regulator transcription factor [Pirellulales bacterium]
MPITVSIVEDHEQTRASIVALLRKAPGLKCLDAYPTAEAALTGVLARTPDVLLVDIRLPRMSGIQCVAQLKSAIADLRVLMLTTYEERELIFDSLRAGASGYILKNALRTELVQAVEQVDAGGAPMSMPIARKLVGFFQDRSPTGSDLENLTQREQEILTLLARGYQYKEIAETAGVKLETVRSHIKHIYDKLHVRSRTEATLKFLGESGRDNEPR